MLQFGFVEARHFAGIDEVNRQVEFPVGERRGEKMVEHPAQKAQVNGPGSLAVEQPQVSANTLHVALAIPEDEAARMAAEGRRR